MARATAVPVSSLIKEGTQAQVTRPSSVVSNWVTVVKATGVDDAANSGNRITNPETSVASAITVPILMRSGGKQPDIGCGTYIRLRLAYDDALTVGTDVVVQVFGRTGDDVWECLPNLAESDEVELTANESDDVTDGTYKYTAVGRTTHTWDCAGSDEIIVGIKTALADGGGDVTNAFIQAKVI